jgi:glycine betaine/proline transport system ATP-binding protein
MQDELLDLQEQYKKTIIFISHDLNEALRIGDRIAIMKDGEVVQVGTGEEIVTQPANDYVRAFVEDVDRSKVLTAENIMIPPFFTNIEVDGPNVALKKMRTEEVSGLIAVDRKRQFRGFITSEDAIRARTEGLSLIDVATDIPTVSPDMLVMDIMPLIYDSPTPLAVVDEDGRLRGTLIRGRVLQALAEHGEEPAAKSVVADQAESETAQLESKEEV